MTALRALPILKKLPVMPVLDTLVTRSPEAHAEQASLIGFRKVTASIEEAAGDDLVDAFDICTPNANHYGDVMAAVQGGKAVYCEKPVTETYAKSVDLHQHVKQGQVSLEQLAFTFRYHPAVMRIKRWLQEGIIGDVLQCNISYRRSGYLDSSRPVSWRMQSDLSGGGAISDLGVHVIDMLRHWFGGLVDLRGRTNTYVQKRPGQAGGAQVQVDVDDWAMMHFTTLDGVSGTAEVSRIALGFDAFDIRIVGSAGSITCDLERDAFPVVHLLKGGSPALPEPECLALLPGDKGTMGFAVDNHFGSLHHFLWRFAGDDRYPGLAPSIEDGVQAEYWIDRVMQDNKGWTRWPDCWRSVPAAC